MKAPGPVAAMLAAGALALLAGPANSADRQVLTGSDDAVWLIRTDSKAGTFDLAVREAEGKWQLVYEAISGRPAAAVASPAGLHVLFADPVEHLIFDRRTGARSTALIPDHPLWPRSEGPVAVCETIDPNTGQTGILAAVARSGDEATTAQATATAPAAATAPASPADGLTLGLFKRVGPQWTHLADMEGLRLSPVARVLLADTDRGTYLLLHDPPSGPDRLTRWRDGQWRPVKIGGPAARSIPVAMLAVKGRLVLLMARAAEKRDLRALEIGLLDEAGQTLKFSPMMQSGDAATWPADRLPMACRMGEQLALVWEDDDANAPLFGTCAPHLGQLRVLDKIDIFDRTGREENRRRLEYLLWAVFAAVSIPMILLRPRGPIAPFSLPDGVWPASLLKRVGAFILDVLPINFIGSLVYSLTPSALTDAEIQELMRRAMSGQGNLPFSLALASVAALTAYVIYCALMQARYGATLGMMLMKLRVVGSEGKRADLRQCVLRNVLLVLELTAIVLSVQLGLLIVIAFVPLFTRYRQRIGDLAARTAVVDLRQSAPEAQTPPDRPPPPDDSPADPPGDRPE